MSQPSVFRDPQQIVDAILARVGKRIVLALPLGLGKANHVANALYERARAEPDLSLTILTALTLEQPRPGSDLERRFLDPLANRFFGDYPALQYAEAMRRNGLPENVRIKEFFLAPGRWLGNAAAQQNYFSINYSHVRDYLLRNGINVLAQLIAPSEGADDAHYSLSVNPDLSIALLDARRRGALDFMAVGQVNTSLPYFGGAAERPAADFDALLTGDAVQFALYCPPQEPVSLADHAIGLHVARLVPDGGTLQVGIGAIGDAVTHSLRLRQAKPQRFRELLAALGVDTRAKECYTEPFETGLYAASEMFVEGFLDLLEANILKREVSGKVLRAGFILGSPLFYEKLRSLSPAQRDKLAMVPINTINELYGDEDGKRRARTDARFINSALMVTLLGAVVSDGLDTGQVISGVGGQHDFVTMAFALQGARSIITLPATRRHRGQRHSNLRWQYGHTTIPRHLRDVVVTEYGVAELRGKTDAEVIAALLAIADSRFQEELLDAAKSAGKIATDYRLPKRYRDNLPGRLTAQLEPARQAGDLPVFPLGSNFTAEEEKLAVALQQLTEVQGAPLAMARLAWCGWCRPLTATHQACLARMQLAQPQGWRERLSQVLLRATLGD
ncbi:MAG: acetyl-CoA hydrolase/transferase C-terminal domain-containing protein [Desulfuromonadales bacterium]